MIVHKDWHEHLYRAHLPHPLHLLLLHHGHLLRPSQGKPRNTQFNYLQETSIAIVVGLIVGVNVFFFTDFFHNGDQGNQEQIRDVIFLLLLPPIMFEDGYNFPKRKFVQNIFYVNLYGLLGTILNFFVVWGGLTLFNNMSTDDPIETSS